MTEVSLDPLLSLQKNAVENPISKPNYKDGKSIVTSCYRQEIPSLFVLLYELKRLQFNLPIEIFYRDQELDVDEINEITKINQPYITFKKIQSNAKNFTDRYGHSHGWSTKVYAIYESEYNENLWLDCDNVPITSAAINLFNDEEYIEKGSLFWRDVYSIDRSQQYEPNSSFWKVFNVPYNDGEPFETGQFLINKNKCWNQLSLMMHYTENCEVYYSFGGDAECWRMAWQSYSIHSSYPFSSFNYHSNPSSVPYGFMPYGPFHKGIQNIWHKYGGGSVMVQRGRDGKELFNHRNIYKWSYGENVFNHDVQNEQIYHMIINHLKIKYPATGTTNG